MHQIRRSLSKDWKWEVRSILCCLQTPPHTHTPPAQDHDPKQ
jgi:hypothetical protein